MIARSVLLLLVLGVAACAASLPAPSVADSGGLRVSLAPYVRVDANLLPLRICVLAGSTAAAPNYRLYTVTTSGAPVTADTTTTTLFYRLVAGPDTVRQAMCSLPGSVPVAAMVLRRLQQLQGGFPVVLDPTWDRERLPPTRPGVLECDSDPTFQACYATEVVTAASDLPEVWRFEDVPFIAADSTDYGVPGSGAYADDPRCLPCKMPSSAFTPVDALNQRLNDDPFYLIRHFGERQ